MLKIHARKFLNHPVHELWDKLNGEFILVFDDGEMKVNERDVLYSRYVWEFHIEYPNIPMLMKHCVRFIAGNERINSKTHLKLIESVLYTVYDTYEDQVPSKSRLMEQLGKKAYEISNAIYNDLSYRLEEYVVGYDILDFLQVAGHPEIVKAIDEMPQSQAGIDQVYKVARKLIKESPDFHGNPVVDAINAGIVRAEQSLQCLVIRGYLTDIDSHIFRKPILRGFAAGIRLASDYMQESRSAAKALANSEAPLKRAEYFSRRTQHICMNVENLHRGDCGSTNYLNWYVRGAEVVDGIQVTKGDLDTIVGKYYLDEATQTLKSVKKTDTHLIGTVIKMRSVMAGCSHPDPYGICEVCYGEGALSVPDNSNIGHYACVNSMEKVSQNVLSTKHYDGSSVVEGIYLMGKNAAYLWAPKNGNTYFLNKSVLHKGTIKLMLHPSEVRGITDIANVDDVRKLNISRVSEFEDIALTIVDSDGLIEDVKLSLVLNSRKPNMTHELLDHIKRHGYTINDAGVFIFDLTGWNCEQPMFSLPMRHFNMSDHQTEIEKFIGGNDKMEAESESGDGEKSQTDGAGRKTSKRARVVMEDVPLDVSLVRFHDLVNRKIRVSLSVLEIVLYASLITDAASKNYRIPKSWDTPQKGKLKQMYDGRSFGALMAYEQHKGRLTDPEQFLHDNRPNHVFDYFLLPREVMEDVQRKKGLNIQYTTKPAPV